MDMSFKVIINENTSHSENASQEARPTLSLKRAVDSKAEKEAKHHNDGEKLCILACGDAFFGVIQYLLLGNKEFMSPLAHWI